jgi:hypothetical protein
MLEFWVNAEAALLELDTFAAAHPDIRINNGSSAFLMRWSITSIRDAGGFLNDLVQKRLGLCAEFVVLSFIRFTQTLSTRAL